jgi:uridine phosphorylase
MRDSELILSDDGSIYHLHLKPGDVAEKILLVGDPDRVERVGKHLDQIDFRCHKREFYTLTGWMQGQKISVISTGIGTDNVDIVIHELDALFNIDFGSRKPKTQTTALKLLRLGTCGGMQKNIPVGSLIASAWAIGGDGLMQYYDQPLSEEGQLFARALMAFRRHEGLENLAWYFAQADPALVNLLEKQFPQIHCGITYTAGGFYGPQGRSLGRLPVRHPDLPQRLARFQHGGFPVLNMEMEASAVLGLGTALGHQAGCLCVILANRQAGEFAADPAVEEQKLIKGGLEVMLAW